MTVCVRGNWWNMSAGATVLLTHVFLIVFNNGTHEASQFLAFSWAGSKNTVPFQFHITSWKGHVPHRRRREDVHVVINKHSSRPIVVWCRSNVVHVRKWCRVNPQCPDFKGMVGPLSSASGLSVGRMHPQHAAETKGFRYLCEERFRPTGESLYPPTLKDKKSYCASKKARNWTGLMNLL